MTLEKYKSMKKAKNVREEKKLKNIDIDALIKKKSKKSPKISEIDSIAFALMQKLGINL